MSTSDQYFLTKVKELTEARRQRENRQAKPHIPQAKLGYKGVLDCESWTYPKLAFLVIGEI